ncbi:hypothetical protein ACJ41O_007305 [Fusarium nematophilum]
MAVDLLYKGQPPLAAKPAFLKLFDRRFSEQLRRHNGIEPWTPAMENAYAQSVKSGAINQFLHDLHHPPNFQEDTEEDWDDAQNEAFLADELLGLYKAEVAVYEALRDYQGHVIPRLLAAVDLDLAPNNTILQDKDFEPFKVKGILLQHIDGPNMWGMVDRFPQSSWQGIVDQAVKIIQILDLHHILNKDVRPENFLVSTIPDGDHTQYQVYMIDFALCRFRGKDESDLEWGREKHTRDEEGAIALRMQKFLEKHGFTLQYQGSLRYAEWADAEDSFAQKGAKTELRPGVVVYSRPQIKTSKPSRDGLIWDDRGLELEPRWKSEPSLEAIKKVCQRALELHSPDDCAVSLLGEGAFNRVYVIEKNHQERFTMRVSLPVDPYDKTAGEVATLRWLERHSDIPAPRVVAFEDSASNEIGFEWILMRHMSGITAYRRWRKLSMEVKEALVEKIAEYQAQLFSTSPFRTIGTLKDDGLAVPGRLVYRMLFWGQHFDYDIPRGPFLSSHDWLRSLIDIIVQDQAKEVEEAEDGDDKEGAEHNLKVAHRLADLLPKIFPSIQNPPERTFLWHDDLYLQNIMVDDSGVVTAIIDWECVSAMPLWVATQMPKFLRGATREKEPRREGYADEVEDEAAARRDVDPEDDLDNQGKDGLYWIHRMEYEQTQLRKVYSGCMSRLWAGWDEAVADGALKADFLGAVVRCADGVNLKRIEVWVDAIERGEFPSLADTLRATRLDFHR